MQLLVSLNRIDGITIIVVEHRVNELAKYFPRLAVMFEGEVIMMVNRTSLAKKLVLQRNMV